MVKFIFARFKKMFCEHDVENTLIYLPKEEQKELINRVKQIQKDEIINKVNELFGEIGLYEITEQKDVSTIRKLFSDNTTKIFSYVKSYPYKSGEQIAMMSTLNYFRYTGVEIYYDNKDGIVLRTCFK